MNWSWRKLLRHSWPMFAQVVVFAAAAIITGEVLFSVASLGFSCGWTVASISAWREGMNDREEIISHVYGKRWGEDAVWGRRLRERVEEAKQD